MGSRHSRRHSASCDPKPSSPHNTIPRQRCSVESWAGLPRLTPAGSNDKLLCITPLTNCCLLGTGSCFGLSDTLSWLIIRNSFLVRTLRVKGFSFFFVLLATPFPHFVGVNGVNLAPILEMEVNVCLDICSS